MRSSNALWTASHVTGSMLMLKILFAPGIVLYMLVKVKDGPVIFGPPPHA
ncbi:MAG TPA: hypothetical protein VF040_16045 [Ktedonobacterales bacterium]